MTTDIHPEDLELFEYVEGELGELRRAEVELHIEQCSRCADEIHALEAGKEALRTAPLLQLPEKRAGLILGDLPRQDDDGRARVPFFTPKRLIAVLTPVAAVLVVVMVLVNTNGEESTDEAAAVFAEPAPAERAPAEPTPASEPEAVADEATAQDALRSEAAQAAPEAAPDAPAEEIVEEAAAAGAIATVAGPPAVAARFLRDEGFDAQVKDGAVQVRGATPTAVLRALESYRSGTVPVVIP